MNVKLLFDAAIVSWTLVIQEEKLLLLQPCWLWSLNVIDPHKLIGSGPLRNCGFVEGSVPLGVGFEVSCA